MTANTKQQPLLWRKYSGQHVFRNYLNLYRGYYGRFFLALIFHVIKFSPVFLVPIITADIINLITEEPYGTTDDIVVKLIIGLIVILQNVPTHVIYALIVSKINRGMEFDVRTSLCARLQHLSMHYHHEHKTGSLQTKILRDVENIEALTRTFVDTVPSIACQVIVAIIMTSLRAPMFLIFFLILIPISKVFQLMLQKRITERNHDFRISMELMNGYINEMLRLIPVTRAHSSENIELARVRTYMDGIRKAGYKMDSVQAIFGSMTWVNIMCFNMITLALACYLKLTEKLTIATGDIVLMTGYFNTLSGAVLTLLNMIPQITKGMESVKSIGEILECRDLEQNEGKAIVSMVEGEFKFEHVDFQYNEGPDYQLKDFSYSVKPGETIALVGPSGAGKSTIVQLVIGFNRPTHGKIYLDGVDMDSLDLRTYRRFISVVTQETVLFDGSIRDNIAYGLPSATQADVERVVREANLAEFVNSLPEGLDTQVHENGSRLSGGQRQRIAIARALLRNPRVLILDEATSALDVESETEIKQELDRLMVGRTTFVVAHRLSTIHNADHIIVMDHGAVAEIGNHQELMEKNGIYADMYRKFTQQE